MRISVTEAAENFSELAKLAERGEEVILTQDGRPSLQLVPIAEKKPLSREEKQKVFDEIRKSGPKWASDFDTNAARSQDFLYDENGLPK